MPLTKKIPVKESTHLPTKELQSHDKLFLITLAMDLVLLNLTIFGAMWYQTPLNGLEEQSPIRFWVFFAVVNALWFLVATFTDIYWIVDRVNLNMKMKNTFQGSLIYFGMLSIIYHSYFCDFFQIHFIIPSMIVFTGMTLMLHFFLRSYFRTRLANFQYAIVGGTPDDLRTLEKAFRTTYGRQAHCVGRFADMQTKGMNHLGKYEDISNYLNHYSIDKLFYFNSTLSSDQLQDLARHCRGRYVEFEIIPQTIDLFEKGVQVEQLAHLPIFCRKKEPLHRLQNRFLKRFFDLLLSSLVIVLIFPWLFPIIAIMIKLDSRGPIFFKQKRTGYWNKPFDMLKFRSMTVNKDSDTKQATRGDSRITRVGAFLRKTNLDELPQIINVFLGHMSLVGPRPHMLKHTEDYAQLIETFMIRHEVKPGITGWAQVKGFRGPTEDVSSMVQRVECDVHYIENWSIWLDGRCLLLTVLNMIRGEENAF